MSAIAVRQDKVETRETQPSISHSKIHETVPSVHSTALNVFSNTMNQPSSKSARLTKAIISGLASGAIFGAITYIVFKILGIPTENSMLLLASSYLLFGKDVNLFSSDLGVVK